MKWKCAFLLSGAALVALASSASAADIPSRVAPIAPVPYVYNWTGFYAGINGGAAWGDAKIGGSRFFGDFNGDHVGGTVGGTFGYNLQYSPFVLGVETDIQWADLKSDGRCRGGLTCEVKTEWFGTARGRVGYAWDRWMPYVTGGLAYGDLRARVTGFPGRSDTVVGWTVGGGVEFALSVFSLPPAWTGKVEYLYVDLGDFSCGRSCGPRGSNDVETRSNVVRAGLNYRF
jgi:outer membrane immunogenic protein